MLNIFVLVTKYFNNLKSIFFVDFYLNLLLTKITTWFINLYSVLILEKYILDFALRRVFITTYNTFTLYLQTSTTLSILVCVFVISNISILYVLL